MNIEKISNFDAMQFLNKSTLPSSVTCTELESVYIDKQKCEGVYRIIDKTVGSESSYSDIYLSCCETQGKQYGKFYMEASSDCNFVAKWQSVREMNVGLKMNNTIENMINEAQMQYKVAQLGMAPMVREVMVCQEGTIIIMDALSITVKDEMKLEDFDVRKKILKKIMKLLAKLHSYKIIHGILI